MKLKLLFIIFGVIFFNKIKSQLIQISLLLVVIHYLLCNSFIDTKSNFIWKQILFLLVIFFNIQQLSVMLNSFIKLSVSHKTSITTIGLHYISFKVKKTTFYNHYQLYSVVSLIARASFAQERIFLR